MSLYAHHLHEYENLKLSLERISRLIRNSTNVNLNGLTVTYKQILPSTIEGFEKVLGNENLFTFLSNSKPFRPGILRSEITKRGTRENR